MPYTASVPPAVSVVKAVTDALSAGSSGSSVVTVPLATLPRRQYAQSLRPRVRNSAQLGSSSTQPTSRSVSRRINIASVGVFRAASEYDAKVIVRICSPKTAVAAVEVYRLKFSCHPS